MNDYEPPHRIQKRPLPESASVIAAARTRRQAVLATLHPWTRSEITEDERTARNDDLQDDANNA
jgi:hypothetical protein